MFIARLAMDRRGSAAWFGAVVLMCLAVRFTFWGFAIAAIAFAGSRAVMSAFFGAAFCHFADLLGISSGFDTRF